jgi:predicted RNase H-like nuclease (RuvC/YqgF family)
MNKEETMALAEDFAHRFYAGDIQIITPPEVMRKTENKVNDMAKEAAYHLMCGRLVDELNLYMKSKSYKAARRLVKAITSARANGMIVEGESSNSKIKRLEQENAQLKEENRQFKKEIERLKKKNDALNEVIKRISPAERDNPFGDEN